MIIRIGSSRRLVVRSMMMGMGSVMMTLVILKAGGGSLRISSGENDDVNGEFQETGCRV